MSKFEKQVTEFSLDGQVVHLFFEGYKPKYLQLMTSNGIHLIKLSKECRAVSEQLLTPGQQVQVSGWRKVDLKTGKIKLKAEFVALASTTDVSTDVDLIQPQPSPTESGSASSSAGSSCAKKSKILICQKSDCRKRGGNVLYSVLEEALSARGLQDQVALQGTGCLKRCKAGPNLVFMPDKANYSNVSPNTVPSLIEKHLG
ncbi:MAG: (2Fe-2S) ferredoxin domain-containing protein [Microcoleaceae cyanobacterium]